MNGPSLHLMLAHLPVVGSLIAFVLLVAGRRAEGGAPRQVGLVLALVSALSAVPTFLTGPTAVDIVRGLDPKADPYLLNHARAGLFCLLSLLLFGTAAFASMRLTERKPALSANLGKLAVVLGVVAVMVGGYVAQTGYVIRHSEVRATPAK